jgi:hypothetical protein
MSGEALFVSTAPQKGEVLKEAVMFSPLKWALVLPLIGATLDLARQSGKKDARANHAEVRLHDGSLVRMTIVQDSVDVLTKYGKLTIPMREIRRLEFGHHLPEGVEPQIQQAIKQLGDDNFKTRDNASKQLEGLGPMAYPALQKVAVVRSDLEVAKRASLVLKRIDDTAPAEQLKFKHEDTIQTVEFTITGRIVSPAIKVRSETFGEFDLKLSQLRSLHQRTQSGDVEMTVDSAQFGNTADLWLDTGVMMDANLRLTIRADGQVDLWPPGPGQYLATPKGCSTAGKGGVYMAGSLIARIGENGKTFFVGENYDGTPGAEGKVYLQVVPGPWNNGSSGSYKVRLRTDYVALSSR